MSGSYNITAVCGPTASGKTSLAVKIARRYEGEIISGDSRQVYRGMDLGTGKDLNEYSAGGESVPFHLIDVAGPCEEYNLYRYQQDFEKALSSIRERKKLPLIAGGSGLYIEAVLKGYILSDAPENSELREKLSKVPAEELAGMLREMDSRVYAATDLSSTRRIIRGIEIARYGGTVSGEQKKELEPLILAVSFPRKVLKERIDRRLEQRLGEGMLGEAESLMQEGVTYRRMIKLGLEYRYCAMHLKGELTYDEFLEKLKTEIHRFAKRQMTWLRGMERRGLALHWLDGDSFEQACQIIDSSTYIP